MHAVQKDGAVVYLVYSLKSKKGEVWRLALRRKNIGMELV